MPTLKILRIEHLNKDAKFFSFFTFNFFPQCICIFLLLTVNRKCRLCGRKQEIQGICYPNYERIKGYIVMTSF